MKTEKEAIRHFHLPDVENVEVGEIGATSESVVARTDDTADGEVSAAALIGERNGAAFACNDWCCTQGELLKRIIAYLNSPTPSPQLSSSGVGCQREKEMH